MKTLLAILTVTLLAGCAHTHSPAECQAPPTGFVIPDGWAEGRIVCKTTATGGVSCREKTEVER